MNLDGVIKDKKMITFLSVFNRVFDHGLPKFKLSDFTFSVFNGMLFLLELISIFIHQPPICIVFNDPTFFIVRVYKCLRLKIVISF